MLLIQLEPVLYSNFVVAQVAAYTYLILLTTSGNLVGLGLTMQGLMRKIASITSGGGGVAETSRSLLPSLLSLMARVLSE